MKGLQEISTDLTSHHIEGIALEGNIPFSVPLITQVDETLWQGGCVDGVSLNAQFANVISLYPWERFKPGIKLLSFLEVQLWDSGDLPDNQQLYSIARWVNICRKTGPTLVHCQAGLNRSGLVTALALILEGMEPADAIAKLRQSRCNAVLCNKAFERWLLQRGVEQ